MCSDYQNESWFTLWIVIGQWNVIISYWHDSERICVDFGCVLRISVAPTMIKSKCFSRDRDQTFEIEFLCAIKSPESIPFFSFTAHKFMYNMSNWNVIQPSAKKKRAIEWLTAFRYVVAAMKNAWKLYALDGICDLLCAGLALMSAKLNSRYGLEWHEKPWKRLLGELRIWKSFKNVRKNVQSGTFT